MYSESRGTVLLSLILALFCVLIASPVWSATQWIATNGNNGNSCFAGEGSPRQTIASGQACLSAGDTLIAKDGTYNHSGVLTLDRGGSDEGSRVIYKSQNFRGARIAGGTDLKFINVHWVTFDGFVVDGMQVGINNATHIRLINAEIGNSPDNGISEENGDNFELINLFVHDNGDPIGCNPDLSGKGPCHGFYIGDASNGLIDGGVWSGSHDHGIHGRPSCGDNLIIRNATFRNQNAGVAIGCYGGSNVRMYNNTIFDNLGGIQNETSSGEVVHNTIYNNGNFGVKIADGAHNYQNNISYNNGGLGNFSIETGGSTFLANLCNSILAGVCSFSGDPEFRNAPGGDFHIKIAGSPANNNGTFTSLVTTDQDGNNRGNPPEIGAFEFDGAPPPPQPPPIGQVGRYEAEGNADDSSGNGFHGTGEFAFGAGIVGGQSFLFDGINDAVTLPANAAFRPTTRLGLLMWMNANAPPGGVVCRAVSNGEAWRLGWRASDGLPFCDVNGVGSVVGPSSVITGTNRHLACTYTGSFLRLYIDAANPSGATQAASGSIVYTGIEAPDIGGVTDRFCPGRIDGVSIYDIELTPQAILNDFNNMNPSGGVFVTHMAWYAANAPEGVNPSVDSNIISPLSTPKGVRWGLRNSTGVSITEHFRPFFRVNTGTWGPWTELTNSFGSDGIRFLNDTSVNLGDTTTALLPLDEFTATPGKFLADVVDVVGPPYDEVQKITIGPGQQADMEVRFELGHPLEPGNLVQFKPRRESGADLNDFGGPGDPVIKTFTVQGPPTPGSNLQGGTFQGVTVQ